MSGLVFHERLATEKDAELPPEKVDADAADRQLVVYLPFDRGQGKIAHDQSIAAREGEIVGARWVPGRFGHALEFRKAAYVKMPQSEGINGIAKALTLECWAYFDLDKLAGTNGTLISVEPSGLGIHTWTRRYEAKTYLIAVNPADMPITPRFIPPVETHKTVSVLFEDRRMKLRTQGFQDKLEPFGAHVYVIE